MHISIYKLIFTILLRVAEMIIQAYISLLDESFIAEQWRKILCSCYTAGRKWEKEIRNSKITSK